MIPGALRRVARQAAASVDAVAGWPAEAYAAAYVRLGLNRQIHAMGVRVAGQIALLPSRLRATTPLLSQPYRVPLERILWGGRPPGGEMRRGDGEGQGLVFAGDWDIADKRPLMDYLSSYIYSRTVLDYLGEGRPYQSTSQYAEMCDLVTRGQTGAWQARGCRTLGDVDAYFIAMRRTFEAIRDKGYRSQIELESDQPHDEIKVFVDRLGEIHKQQGAGHHRLAMAKIIGVPSLPVLIVGVHWQFAADCHARFGGDVVHGIRRGLDSLCCP